MIKRLYSYVKLNKGSMSNNRGMTLVEMLATFALLGLFMVAATRVIAYVMGIYYAAKGNTYGLEVTNMISNKIIGHLEGASDINTFDYVDGTGNTITCSTPMVINNGDLDTIKFVDSTGSVVTFSIPSTTNVLNINYAQTKNYNPLTNEGYAEVNWFFDPAAYMDYTISKFDFSDPGANYPDNVIRLDLGVHNPKYGEFEATYYIKCYGVNEVTFQ